MTPPTPPVTPTPHGPPALVSREFIEDILLADPELPIGVIVTDTAGTVTHWNHFATSLYGWTSEDAIGRSIVELNVGPLDEAKALEIMDRLGAGDTWMGSFICRRHDGSSVHVNVLDIPLRDDAGEITGIVGLSREVVEQYLETLVALDELRTLADRLDEVRTAEQQRIAAQLHDHLSQPIAMMATEALKLARSTDRTDDAAKLERIGRTLQGSLRTLQNICTSLRPPGLDEFGPLLAIEHMLESWPAMSGVALESIIDPAVDQLGPGVVEVIVQVLTEGLANIERHARATHAVVEILVDGGVCTLTLADDGLGYEGAPGFGVRLMTERARRIGGRIAIEPRPAPGTGTILTLQVPTSLR